jgi:hypothetical protein
VCGGIAASPRSPSSRVIAEIEEKTLPRINADERGSENRGHEESPRSRVIAGIANLYLVICKI